MFLCAQLDAQGVCRCLANLKAKVEAAHIVPLADIDVRIMGRLYVAGAWAALVVWAPKTTIAVGEILPVDVVWQDLDGDVVDVADPVNASSDAGSVEVPMSGGTGGFDFEATDPGSYTITIRAACGVETRLVVTVS